MALTLDDAGLSRESKPNLSVAYDVLTTTHVGTTPPPPPPRLQPRQVAVPPRSKVKSLKHEGAPRRHESPVIYEIPENDTFLLPPPQDYATAQASRHNPSRSRRHQAVFPATSYARSFGA